MYGDTITPAQTREALAELRSRGIATVEFEFSGGNDEGGVDSIRALDAEGNEVALPNSNASKKREWNATTRTYDDKGWVVYNWNSEPRERPATDEEVRISKMREVLERPIYDRYSTFAGEFYVNGTLTWDVTAGTHKMHGQESVQTWEEFSY